MQPCTIIFSQTTLTGVGQAFSPSRPACTRPAAAALIDLPDNNRTRSFAPSPSPCSPAHSPQHIKLAVTVDARGQVDRPVRDLALPGFLSH